jgi:hypothetical protein
VFLMIDEVEDHGTTRRKLRREYQESPYLHIEHVLRKIDLDLDALEAEFKIATTRAKNKVSVMKRIAGQIRLLHAYAGGITPFDSTMSRRIEDAETDGVFHGNVEAHYYITF